MCGIAGLVSSRTAREAREAAVARMQRALVHRGPDESGQCTAGPCTLGIQRLAIFDPIGGTQPMTSSDGRYTLVFNGAIYNHGELRSELLEAGYVFHSAGDTAVLLTAWQHWGPAALRRLRGMFAFAIWDRAEAQLDLVRDPVGIKPVYWSFNDDGLLFASEVRALLASGRVGARIDPAAVDAYLAWMAVPAPRTLYREITALRPGERLSWREGRISLHRDCSPLAAEPEVEPVANRAAFTHHLRKQLEHTIAVHQLADVEVGAFLSGGLDSAAVVALMQRHASTRLQTFSIGFDDPSSDESTAAAATARALGTHHIAMRIGERDVLERLPRFIAALDQPTGDALNTFLASDAARAGGVKVVLSGLGADELFGGYPSFRRVPQLARARRVWSVLPAAVRSAATAHLRQRSSRWRKLADLLENDHQLASLALTARQVLSRDERRRLFSEEPPEQAHPALSELRWAVVGAEPRAAISLVESATYMTDVLLRDSDVMSMAHSLELRVPFVDRSLVAWVRAQRPEFRFGRSSKSALIDAVGDLLPRHVHRAKKRGFSPPLARWMRGALRPFLEELFAPAAAASVGCLDPVAVRRLWDQFLKAHDDAQASRVWTVAMLIAYRRERHG